MNNFVFNHDPLLYNNPSAPIVQPMTSESDIKRQLDSLLTQYQTIQQSSSERQHTQKDYIGELDEMVKHLDEATLEVLNTDVEFMQINVQIQQMIQNEIMNTVKNKLNSSQDVINKVNRAKEIINNTKKAKEDEDRKNMVELNDYIQNYSDMTFNEYKQLKMMVNNK